MAVIQVDKLGKIFNGEYLWKDISFSIDEQEKVGLLGPNGCGKSTLIKALLGEIDIDEGDIFFAKERSLATVSQRLSADEESGTLKEFLLASFKDVVAMERKMKRQQKNMERLTDDPVALEKAILKYTSATEAYERLGGYVMDARIREVLFGLGFCEEDLERTMDTLSGGQKTRVSLARSLVREPDILILDEPNNYLDLEALNWLEAFLSAYRGAVLVVSHDRYFLDAVIGRVLEFENKKLYSYQGNFTEFMEKKDQIIADHNKQYDKQQKKIAETEAYIDKYKAGIKSKQARGRKSQLARLERLEKRGENHQLNMSFEQSVASGKKVLEVKDLSVGYGEEMVVEDISFEVLRGQRLGIIGPNGCGKTTLLKAIGEQLPYKGKVQLGVNVEIGYFSQEHEGLNEDVTVLDVLMDAGVPDYQTALEILAQYGFTNDDIDTLAGRLSGGEKSRLLMAVLLFDQPNLLLLDEPTNHLDVYARQSLEKALANYPGTMVFVSHDRYFLKKVATRLLYYEDGFKKYSEGFMSYLNRPKEVSLSQEPGDKEMPKPMSDKKKERVRTAQINKAERAVDELEQQINKVELLLTNEEVYADPVACEKANKERLQLEDDLHEKMQIWERLMD